MPYNYFQILSTLSQQELFSLKWSQAQQKLVVGLIITQVPVGYQSSTSLEVSMNTTAEEQSDEEPYSGS